MSNYLLDDIRDYLTNDLKYVNVQIMWASSNPNNTKNINDNQILLQDEGAGEIPIGEYNWWESVSIYVRNVNRETANVISKNIMYKLQGFQGFLTTSNTPVFIQQIRVVTPPTWYSSANNLTEILTRFKILIRDPNLNQKTTSKIII